MSPATESFARKRDKIKVLIFAEAVTLAHVTRPHVLALALDPAEFEVCVARDARYDPLLGPQSYARATLGTIPAPQFLDALARGRPLYREAELHRYVEEDLALIEAFDPDLVMGDFRLSLSVSARLAGRPYLAIANAYWSPYAEPRYPVPDLPFVTWLGYRAAQVVFDWVRPFAFALHSRPLERVRRRHGLPSLGWDLRRVYTDADHVLYADLPELVPTRDLPPQHRYLGPVLWEPETPLPAWWSDLPADRPMVFVTLGSSGPAAVLPRLIEALARLPVTLVVATAGRARVGHAGNVFVADYLPARQVLARARLAICNGGSPLAYLALCAGCPVLGVPTNLDQLLNMHYVQQAGAGECLRTGELAPERVQALVRAMLEPRSGYARAARRLQSVCACWDPGPRFNELLRQIIHA